MTYLEIINEVLKRLREDTVSTNTESSYSKLIGTFVKQAAQEVSNAYDWPTLFKSETVSTSAGSSSLSLAAGGGDTAKGDIKIFSIYNTTTDHYLLPWNFEEIERYKQDRSDVGDREEPRWYAAQGTSNGSNYNIKIYPLSDGVYNFQVYWIKRFSIDYTYTDSTVMTLPVLPLVLRATALAISERGEDGGALSSEIDAQYQSALADAISLHESNNNYDNLSWNVV